MPRQVIVNKTVSSFHKVPGRSAEFAYLVLPLPDWPMTPHDALRTKMLDAADGLEVGFYVKIGRAEDPFTVQGLVPPSLDGVTIEKGPMVPIIDAQMSMTVTRKVDDFEKAIGAQAQRFTARQAEENGLWAAAAVPDASDGLHIVIDFMILAIVIVTERKQALG
jgi:hypothetical protein